MRIILVFILAGFSVIAQEEHTFENISNSTEAREFASDHMWAEVVVLASEECKWLLNIERSEDPIDPDVGDMGQVRNTQYKLVADTFMRVINCSVIDFNLEEMSEEEADSLIRQYMRELNSHGRMDYLVRDHLSAEQKYRYNSFYEPTSVIKEYFGTTFTSRSKGEIFSWKHPTEPFKFLVQIMQDPTEIEGYIVLKARMGH